MQMKRWKSYHVRVSTLEKIIGVRLISLRTMFPEGDEEISIRIPAERWEWYGIKDALYELGFENQSAVYVNIR